MGMQNDHVEKNLSKVAEDKFDSKNKFNEKKKIMKSKRFSYM